MCSCAGNVVQDLGFKNKFPREASYHGTFRRLLLPSQNKPEKPQSEILNITVMGCYKWWSKQLREKDESVFHLAKSCRIASLAAGESAKSIKITEMPWCTGKKKVLCIFSI